MKQFPFGVLGLIGAALLLGAAASWLFEAEPLGINFSLWVLTVLVAGAYAHRKVNHPDPVSRRVPLIAAIVFTILLAWREGEPLKQFLVLTILASCLLSAIAAHGRSLRVAYVHEYISDAFYLGLSTFSVPLNVVRGLQEQTNAQDRRGASVALSVFLGVILATPPLIIFGALFSEADPMFKKWFVDVLRLDIEDLAQHVFMTLFFGALAVIAWVLYLEGNSRTRTPREENVPAIGWGGIEINVALGLVATLFLCFIAIQLPYFFGGHERVQHEAGLTYAEYARQGFGELIAVAALSFAMLVGSATLIQGVAARARVAYKAISGVLVASVGVIMASALHRLSLYIDAYGVTSARLYAVWFIVWLAVAFAWLYFTILRDRFRIFAWGFLLSGYAAVFVLAVINPDGLAARMAMNRAEKTGLDVAQTNENNDAWYPISTDAIPAIVDALPRLQEHDRVKLTEQLRLHKIELDKRPRRNWTLSVWNAKQALKRLETDRAR